MKPTNATRKAPPSALQRTNSRGGTPKSHPQRLVTTGSHPPQTPRSTHTRRHTAEMLSQQQSRQYGPVTQSRNASSTIRSPHPDYRSRRAHFDTISETESSASSSSPSAGKTVRSDGGGSASGRSGQRQYAGSSGPKSTVSDSVAVVRRNDKSAAAVKKAIEVLNKAITDDKRIVAITNACAEFDHWDEQKHNAELHYGAADVLTVYLSQTDDDDELRMICAALEMVFRSSPKHVKTAFGKVGSSILPLLLRLLERCESNQVKHADVIAMNITKILLIFSRVPDLRAFLARHPGMLDALKRVATSVPDADSRILRMRVFANVANSDANKLIILEHPGLLESLLRIAALDTSETAREYAGLSLMDLASEPDNQVPMANIDKLLGTLVKLAIMEEISDTRESAVTALQNLAYSKENRVRLTTYGSGVVLEALKKAVGTDKDSKARRRAAGALVNLACEETGERMGSHKGLLDTLAQVCIRDDNKEVQQRAAMALTKIASCVTRDMPCHKNVLDALVVASESPQAISHVMTVLRGKAREPELRECMAFHPGILDALSDVSVKTKLPLKDRDNAMRAIMHLTNEPHNCKVMCCKKVLNALVVGVSQDEECIATSAITAMERLATEFSNRPHMARHDGLLTAVAKATEREAKLEASGMDKSLPLLAKPLLMSLLVAM